ncbi:MAG TPA: FAD-dependent oxidoreductase [Solirubrobacteraceae bacterium]|nr:FAD-dependent oxidoreductase [Solirubrobacteraceae bacterium]
MLVNERTVFEVVVCGGGVAAIEGLLRLRRLGGDRVATTLVTPADNLLMRPLAVQDPFAGQGARDYPIARIVADTQSTWVKDAVASVDPAAAVVRMQAGRELAYDALLLAIGGREQRPFEHADAFTGRNADRTLHGLVRGIETGRVNSVAFVLPHEWMWPLPLYELALLSAARARSLSLDSRFVFVTAEGRPLKAFGRAAGDALERLLAEAGIQLHTGVSASVPAAGIVSLGETSVEAQRIVTLPRITGPALAGIPAGTRWFVPIDDRCVVTNAGGRVFAAGDATDFPVKHGGIAAQQADTAAEGILHLAGLSDRPAPMRPVIRGMLLTGGQPLYVSAEVVDGLGWRSEVHERPPWPLEDKIVAEELGRYLRQLDAAGG